MKQTKILCILLCTLLVFTGCELFLSPILPESWLSYAPTAEALSSLPTSDLEAAITSDDIFESLTNDPVRGKAMIEAFGTKDEQEIQELSDKAKDNIIVLTTATVCNFGDLISTVVDVMNSENGNEPDMNDILGSIFEAVTTVDTTATAIILEEKAASLGQDETITDTNVILAAVTMALSACKENEVNTSSFENLTEAFDGTNDPTPSAFVASFFGEDASESSIRSMTVALTVLQNVDFDNFDFGNLILG